MIPCGAMCVMCDVPYLDDRCVPSKGRKMVFNFHKGLPGRALKMRLRVTLISHPYARVLRVASSKRIVACVSMSSRSHL